MHACVCVCVCVCIYIYIYLLGMDIYNNLNIPVLLLSYKQVIDYSQIMHKCMIFFLM